MVVVISKMYLCPNSEYSVVINGLQVKYLSLDSHPNSIVNSTSSIILFEPQLVLIVVMMSCFIYALQVFLVEELEDNLILLLTDYLY